MYVQCYLVSWFQLLLSKLRFVGLIALNFRQSSYQQQITMRSYVSRAFHMWKHAVLRKRIYRSLWSHSSKGVTRLAYIIIACIVIRPI